MVRLLSLATQKLEYCKIGNVLGNIFTFAFAMLGIPTVSFIIVIDKIEKGGIIIT